MPHRVKRLLIAVFLAAAGAASAQTCDVDGPACAVPEGTYRAALPETPPPRAGYPAVVFFHGAGGNGKQTLMNTGMVDAFIGRGYAVLAPDGLPRSAERPGGSWSFHPDRPQRRDELAFTRAVIADAAKRYRIDPDRVLLSGFSIGGSLVWYLACQDPTVATAYAPVAGAFWRPHPSASDCNGPVRLLHTHGWRDQTVPLEGRPLRGGAILQGDVFAGLGVLRDLNACTMLRADAFDTEGPFWRRVWTSCAPGTALELALHTGGHSVPPGWAEMAMDWFEGLAPGTCPAPETLTAGNVPAAGKC